MILVNDRDKVEWKENFSIQDLLDEMGFSYVLITVSVNEKFIPKEDYETFILDDKSHVNVFHLAHGG